MVTPPLPKVPSRPSFAVGGLLHKTKSENKLELDKKDMIKSTFQVDWCDGKMSQIVIATDANSVHEYFSALGYIQRVKEMAGIKIEAIKKIELVDITGPLLEDLKSQVLLKREEEKKIDMEIQKAEALLQTMRKQKVEKFSFQH